MTEPVIGLVSPGHMGSGLAGALKRGGARVVASLAGRSARTARLAEIAGVDLLPSLDDVVAAAEVVLVVTPPEAARSAAAGIAAASRATGARPLVADLNAVSPATVTAIAGTLREPVVDLVDGSISGPPPSVRPGARIYLSGPRAAEVAALPWRDVRPIVVGPELGTASAIKMCTASVYKGTTALHAQALLAAAHLGVLDAVLADLREGLGADPVPGVVMAATKSPRYLGEMHEIARTQADVGLPALFGAVAEIYAAIAAGELARADPESVDTGLPAAEVVTRLRPT